MIVINARSYFSAISHSLGVLIIVPSSSIISQHTPHSLSPASLSKSTVASVCPFLTSTPPLLATRGNTCPGLLKSSGFESGSMHFLIVYPRSLAEIPVVVSTWSIETVKAVSWLSVFSDTIAGKLSFLAISLLIGVQMSPLAILAIMLIFSCVANSAAQIISPSFSLSGSSVHRIIFPALRSSSALSIESYSRFLLLIVSPFRTRSPPGTQV